MELPLAEVDRSGRALTIQGEVAIHACQLFLSVNVIVDHGGPDASGFIRSSREVMRLKKRSGRVAEALDRTP
jgi:hypothetical protein